MRRALRTLILIVAGGAPAVHAASFPPHLRFRSLVAPRVTVHFHHGLEMQAREAAALATEILARHEARYGQRLGRVQVVLADTDDDPNGFASPLPYPMVHVRAAAPDGSDEFGNHDSWLRLVLTHELAHVVHLEQARGLPGFGRKVFGRAPFLFLNASAATWMVEGLATFEETEGTAFGRGRNPDSRMVVRMAALEGDFPGEDRAVAGLDRWPAGQAAYLFGEAFLRDLTEKTGPDTLPSLSRVHAGRPLPFLDDRTAAKVTGRSFHALWKSWRAGQERAAAAEAERLAAPGLTASRALTRTGVRQTTPRFSPDGRLIAYTSGTLTRLRGIRVMRADGTGDRLITSRNGGTALAWTPDGRWLVYDEPDTHRLFATYSDLRAVEVATGRRRRLTRGARAQDPDVAPDGRAVVFVRQTGDGSELATIGLDGQGQRDLTRSERGVQWSHPRFSPRGDVVAASRWRPGGWLDVVLVDASTGEVQTLLEDRAKDVEPAWTPDGSHVVVRSDRDGVSNVYALRLADRRLSRLTRVLGGAFAPEVSPDGGTLAFASYSARGYDLHVTGLDLASAPEAEPFRDEHPPTPPEPPPVEARDKPYRPLSALLPRFWTPYFETTSEETRLGAATGGVDPLFRHLWALDARYGLDSRQVSTRGFYQYDRFWPTFAVALEDARDLAEGEVVRTRELTLRASVPLSRSLRSSQSLGVAWRRSRQWADADPEPFDLGGLEATWAFSSSRRYAYSVSSTDGVRLRLSYLREASGLGSDLALSKVYGDARAYLRLGAKGALALRAGGGTTIGEERFKRPYAVGGFPDGALFDIVRTNLSVLRGYPDDAFTGRRFAHANLELRLPLAHPQRGLRSLPFFLRHAHAAVFVDAAHAWDDGRGHPSFRLRDARTGAGAALGFDWNLGHALPLSVSVGVARGFAEGGQTRAYVRTGASF